MPRKGPALVKISDQEGNGTATIKHIQGVSKTDYKTPPIEQFLLLLPGSCYCCGGSGFADESMVALDALTWDPVVTTGHF